MMRKDEAAAKERKFYNALRDIFVGAKVEGESGYINLMRVKSRYYENGVLPRLKKDVGDALKPFPGFREELFDKLYTFFNRYFSETGSIYFNYTPPHQSVYEKVYADDRDVMLFYKTHMLYYVKTDRLFRSMDIEVDGHKFFFDVSALEHKKANEKRGILYEFRTKRKDGTLVFNVVYSKGSKKTKTDDILRGLRKQGVRIGSDVLERAFNVFEKQSEVDYFINKNAKAFLREQFDLWLYQYIFSGESEWTEERIRQLQALKEIAFKIIAFISQFEDELVKIWNKPKFVLNSNYIITLDRIAERDMGLARRLLRHKNFELQVNEWRQLGIVGGSFSKSNVVKGSKGLNAKYRYLPIDTKYFKDLELEILGLFENLDEALDGWLIKSENYQALNTLLPKFRELVKCIYIDPPYNTGNDEFMYKDSYQHSSWLSMMADRLSKANALMAKDGLIFVSADDNEQAKLRILLDSVFQPENFRASIAWEKRFTRSNNAKTFASVKDWVLAYRASEAAAFFREPRTGKSDAGYANPDNDPRGDWTSASYVNPASKSQRPNLVYPIINPFTGKQVKHPTNAWKYELQEHQRHDKENRLWWGLKGELTYPRLKVFLSEVRGLVPVDLWSYEETGTTDEASIELQHLFGRKVFDNPKPCRLVERCGSIAVNNATMTAGLVLDFFAGSGTTAHAVINLNRQDGGKRKYILVEMADYFETVLLPRIKKVVFAEKWKDGKPVAQNGDFKGIDHFIKYYELEQYEDTLHRTSYEDAGFFDDPRQDPYTQYVFLRDLKMLEALEVDLKRNRVKVDLSKLYENIDAAETLSNLRGKWVKRVGPGFVEFKDGERVDTRNLDYRLIKPLIWW